MKRNTKKCKYCDRQISLSNYNLHLNSCRNQKKPSFSVEKWLRDGVYYCPICNFSDSRKLALVSHYHRKHTVDGQKIVKNLSGNSIGHKAWNKGLTKYNHPSLMKLSKSLKNRKPTFKGKKHTSETRQKMRLSTIQYIRNQFGNCVPRKGTLETEILNFLEKNTNIRILRDVCILGYFPDGYIDDLKICIEIDESFHRDQEFFRDRDKQKDFDYKQNEFFIFRVDVLKYLKNKTEILDCFKFMIDNLKLNLSV